MFILSQILLSETMEQRHQCMRAKCGMMLGFDKFKEPAAGSRKTKLSPKAYGRNHGRALLFGVQLHSESLHFRIEGFLLFGIHPSDRRRHQITLCLIEFVVSRNHDLQLRFRRRASAGSAENSAPAKMP